MPLPGNALERAHARIDTLKSALRPFAAKVHDDGVDAPYPEELWEPWLTAAKLAVDADDKED